MAGFSYDAGTGEAGRPSSSPPRKEPTSDWGPTASGGDAQASLDSNDTSRGSATSSPSKGDDALAGQGGAFLVGDAGDSGTSPPSGGANERAGRGGSAAAGKAGGGTGGLGGSAGASGHGGNTGAGGTLARGGTAGRAGGGSSGEHDSGGGGASGPGEHALLFSEYVEGSAGKALELRALTTSSLEGCAIVLYSNGATTGKTSAALAGELAADHTYVICSRELAEELDTVCDRKFGVTFSGNDAVTLECDDVVLDAIGQVGVDPGTAWSGSGASTADQTLRRRCSVTRGDTVATDPFDPSLEWQSHPLDDLTGLGTPDCD